MSLGRTLRTVRHLLPAQAAAQLAYAIRARVRGPGVRPLTPRGKVPPYGVDSPAVPFLDAPAHAGFDGERMRLVGHDVHFAAGAIDWAYRDAGSLWAYQLHFFEWLRTPGLGPEHRAHCLLDWIERNREGVGWDPHPLSVRSMNWLKLLVGAERPPLDPRSDERIRSSLSVQLDTLAQNLEVRLQANHLLHNLIALVFAGLAFGGPGAQRWRAFEAALVRELAEQIGADGAHCERSPSYHSILLEAVLDLVNLCRARGTDAPPRLAEDLSQVAARMLAALKLWTHPDGEIALFGDSAFELAHRPRELHRYASALGIEPSELRDADATGPSLLSDAGFARWDEAPFVVIASLAGPRPAHQPGHAHCDALAFELSVHGQRVVTDTGVYEYVPGERRDRCRATRAHATIEVDGRDQAEVWAAHRIGGRPKVALERVETSGAISASCRGWSSPQRPHQRRFDIDTGGLRIRDSVAGRGPLRSVVPLAPGLEPRWEGSNRVYLSLGDGAGTGGGELEIALPSALTWREERAPYYARFGSEQERSCLVGEGNELRDALMSFRMV